MPRPNRPENKFAGIGVQPVEPAVRDLRQVAGQLTRWVRVSSRTAQVLSKYAADHDLQELLDAMSPEQQAELRLLWPVLQAADAVLDAPADIPDLPVAE